jgi:precorrin-4 methylase
MQKSGSTGSLTAVGSGIKSIAHLTLEAQAHIKAADQVLVCAADAVTDGYVRELNPHVEDLHVYYGQDRPRRETYRAMADRMMWHVQQGKEVVVVMYGHPGVFVNPTFVAIEELRALGYATQMLPGVSAEDCLIADLQVDPAAYGLQTYEATYFLTRRVTIDTCVPLVLWQVGLVADHGFSRAGFDGRHFDLLRDRLIQLYTASHEVTIYEAAQHPLATPRVLVKTTGEITHHDVSAISTMFIPPRSAPETDWDTVRTIQERDAL